MPELDKKSPVCPDCLACGFPFWEQLTPEEQEFLCRTTRPVKYKKGERVHSPVENCVGILLLRTGQLRAYLLSEDGRDVTLYRLFPGRSASSRPPVSWIRSILICTSTPRRTPRPTASALERSAA